MTNYELGNLTLQFLTLAVLASTLLKLREYTRETKRLADAAVEEMSRLCVEVFTETDQTDGAIIAGYSASISGMHSIAFRNIGTGAALNFRYQIQTSQPKPYSAAGPSLAPGQVFSSSAPRNSLSDPATVICEFETLSGAKYRTESTIESLRWVRSTRFEKAT